jgi:hypothetical protein
MSTSGPMTMQQSNHPDDERLAALAASEPDALADSLLVTHVSGCSRCAPMVDDLRTLQSALAQLPDVQPSRPLRFLPAVPEPASQGSRWLGLLRGVTGPAMAVAVLLIVVGAFGTAFGNGIGFMSSAGAAPAVASQNNLDAASSARAPAPTTSESGKGQLQPGSSASSVPAAAGSSAAASVAARATPLDRTGGYIQGRTSSPELGGVREPGTTGPPFGLMLGFGVVLLAAAFVARGYLRRRSLA